MNPFCGSCRCCCPFGPQGTGWELVEKQPSVPWQQRETTSCWNDLPFLLAIHWSIWVEVGFKKITRVGREIEQLQHATTMEIQALNILNDG